MIEAVEKHEGKVEYMYMDIEKFEKIAGFLGIKSVPVTYLIKNGALVHQVMGVPKPEAIEEFINMAFVELKVAKHNEGEGELVPKGSTVKVHYTGKLADGTVFDSSVTRGEPIEFVIGEGQVIPGWDQGITQLKKGQKATLTIPPHLAYGEQGAGKDIPPNSTLTFDVEVVDFKA